MPAALLPRAALSVSRTAPQLVMAAARTPHAKLRSSRPSRSGSSRSSSSSSSRPSPRSADVAADLRTLMAASAQPVALLLLQLPSGSASSPAEIHGATISSLVSLSVSPALVAFSLKTPSRAANALLASASSAPLGPTFTLSILAEHHASLAGAFAAPGLKPCTLEAGAQPGTLCASDADHPLAKVGLLASVARGPSPIPRIGGIGSLACSLVGRVKLGGGKADGASADADVLEALSMDGRLDLPGHDPAQAGKEEGESWLLLAQVWQVEGADDGSEPKEGPLVWYRRGFTGVR
ncbi:hypothetical protein FA09DRAFT_325851 [Tilletiopsis washingtonensis]|jgi:flavin reductase (DIM6/NTAB) family NADH-FMN oxidoreductase RutF|uniref:Flavin reductase like domain-containing protein n=1 Tax=Tilletiopsis washingtonensis TaxID=58919 RepID=A0A316Z5X5_9BASI|nr:hypothetical protein FA09DRAFT_325851 [Tilletiopsis washingtonensis]PWN97019.1 hypothetical protein FA09DRAFT_325851 [Tilletiopsis washingtonensis]